jgi:hypothetical protein
MHATILFLTLLQIDNYGVVSEDGFNQQPSPGVQETLNCATGDAHAATGLILIQTFRVAKPHGLELVERQQRSVNFPKGNPLRFVDAVGNVSPTATVFSRSRHCSLLLLCAYAHNIIRGRDGVVKNFFAVFLSAGAEAAVVSEPGRGKGSRKRGGWQSVTGNSIAIGAATLV